MASERNITSTIKRNNRVPGNVYFQFDAIKEPNAVYMLGLASFVYESSKSF